MHIFPPLPLCGLLCSLLLPSCYRRHLPVSLTLYIKLIFLTVLVFFVSCFTVSQYHSRHIIINVSRSKCEYFVFSVSDAEACTFHEMYIVDLTGWMYGWMDEWMDGVYSLLCKTQRLFRPHEREMYLLFVPFEQLVQHVF